MADDNDDSWLYGANHEEGDGMEKEPENSEDAEQNANIPEDEQPNFDQQQFDEHNFEEAGEDEQVAPGDSPKPVKASFTEGEEGNQDSDNEDEDDDDDDDINVVIGDIKSGGANFVKSLQDKQKSGTGSKFSIEEFESVGSIAGQPATEFSLDNIEDKPWRKPGADITDYFNYGFNEETWRAYCERQKRLRINESCVGLTGLAVGQNQHNVEQKQQGGLNNIKRMGHRQKPPGTIDVIGSASSSQMNQNRPQAPRENVIQVMTADRREYSRTVVGNQQGTIGGFNPGNDVYYNNDEPDPYSYGYEPTQDTQQWDQNPGPNWAPREIKELTGGMSSGSQQPIMNIPPPSLHVQQNMNPMMQGHNPMMIPPLVGGMQSKPPMMMDSRDRRDRDMQPRGYDQRKRMRSNSRERDRKDPRRDNVRESTRERESAQRDRRTRTDDRREPREREERAESRRTDDRRDRSREKKRSRSKERSKRSRSKDKKADDSKDRRSSTKK